MAVADQIVASWFSSTDLSNKAHGDPLNSTVTALAGGIVDVGVSLAKPIDIGGHEVFLGVSPKFQNIYALHNTNSVDDFDDDDFDFDDEYSDKSAFNLDIGLAYQIDESITLGFSGRNLIEQELKTNLSYGSTYTYLIEPEYTIGAEYNKGWFSVAADMDLNRKNYFKELDYKTQYTRIGAELNGWDWVAVRAGYQYSMTDSADDLLSFGFGFTPFGIFGLDLAGQVGKDNHYGASAQLVFNI